MREHGWLHETFGTPDVSPVPWSEVGKHVVICAVGMAPLMTVCLPVGKALFPKTREPKQPRDRPGGDLWVADSLFGLFFFLFLVPSIWRAVFHLYYTTDSRWFGRSTDSHWCGVLLVARMLLHIGVIFLKGVSTRRVLLVHHILVISVYALGVHTGQSQFWGCLNATCETSGVFTMMLELFQSARRPVKDWWSFKLNSIMMSACFAFRMVLFPAMMVLWLRDVYKLPTQTWADPRNGVFERFLIPLATVGIYLLSYNDCRSIFKGTLKALGIEVDNIVKVHRPIILACLFLGIAVALQMEVA